MRDCLMTSWRRVCNEIINKRFLKYQMSEILRGGMASAVSNQYVYYIMTHACIWWHLNSHNSNQIHLSVPNHSTVTINNIIFFLLSGEQQQQPYKIIVKQSEVFFLSLLCFVTFWVSFRLHKTTQCWKHFMALPVFLVLSDKAHCSAPQTLIVCLF